jgi:phospholipase C
MKIKNRLARACAAAGAATATLSALVLVGGSAPATMAAPVPVATKTPIQHLVVIFQENESFDHYFATYPVASNPAGEDTFTPASSTKNSNAANTTINNLVSASLLSANPNGANPQRLDPGPNSGGTYNGALNVGTGNDTNAGIDNVLTCSQNHNYQPEQLAFDGGAMDKFPGNVGSTSSAPEPGAPQCQANTDLDYYDGNTVTGYWNYAQHFAMSDNNFGSTFGPSTPGAVNVASGDTGNFNLVNGKVATAGATTSPNSALVPDGDGAFSDTNDSDPFFDDCSSHTSNIGINNTSASGPTAENVGDQLSMAGISWGWFEGGFDPTSAASGTMNPGYSGGPGGQPTGYTPATRTSSHDIGTALGGTGATGAQPYGVETDYIQHHEPFQYFATTANPSHLVPTALNTVGTDTQSFTGGCYGCGTPEFNTPNHQYDVSTFNQLLTAISNGQLGPQFLPAVSYLKAPAYEDEHPSYSDPIDGQTFVTQEVNAIMQSPDWSTTAIVVTYDDSDGWYDHVYAGNASDVYNTSPTGAQNQSSAGAGTTSSGGTATGSTTEGDAETAIVCGGTPITGSTIASSTTITTGSNDTITYTVGGGSTQTATIAGGSYSPTSLANAIATASGGVIKAQANSTPALVLTDNGLNALAITGGDALSSLGLTASTSSTPANPVLTNYLGAPENGRCGLGPRLPFIVISPYAKTDYISHKMIDQASVVNFIEYNWGLGEIEGSAANLFNNPSTSFDLADLFDFTPGATDVSGLSPYYLGDPTFQQVSTPNAASLPPLPPGPPIALPETHFPALLPVAAAVLVGGGVWFLSRRRRVRQSIAQ